MVIKYIALYRKNKLQFMYGKNPHRKWPPSLLPESYCFITVNFFWCKYLTFLSKEQQLLVWTSKWSFLLQTVEEDVAKIPPESMTGMNKKGSGEKFILSRVSHIPLTPVWKHWSSPKICSFTYNSAISPAFVANFTFTERGFMGWNVCH